MPTHTTPDRLTQLQSQISASAFAEEQACVTHMLSELEPMAARRTAIFMRASALVKRIREVGSKGVEAFLHTYGLDTREGVAVMCLAEALLRIPDPVTAGRLIRDKFEHTEWARYLGSSDSFFVNASSWGLLLTGTVVNLGGMPQEKPASVLGRLVSRTGEPVVREALKKAMRMIGTQFVLGETIEDAIAKAKPKEKTGYRFSYDILGEGARNQNQAEGYVAAYRHAIDRIGKKAGGDLMAAPSISVKLSALHPRYQLVKETRVFNELLPRLKEILERAMAAGITVSIDAEEATRLDIELKLFRALLEDPRFAGYDGIGFVLQAYQKRAVHVVDYLAELCRSTGRRILLRLVKGAYWDSEIKNAQMMGLSSYPVFTRKEHTDVSYMACAQRMMAHLDCFFPQFATHNALTVAAIRELAGDKRGAYEFQRLHGMGEELHDQVVGDVPCRIYAPVGRHEDLLAYLIRRLLENGANTSFVNLLMDKEKPLEALLEDPIARVRADGGNQNAAIANPVSLYSDRRNSQGFDLGNMETLKHLGESLSSFDGKQWKAQPTAARTTSMLAARDILEPGNARRKVGQVTDADGEAVEQALLLAKGAFAGWAATPVTQRAAIFDKAADMLEMRSAEAMALAMREAGKTWGDAIAEVREAVDFCRYYALHARRLMQADQVLQGPTGEHNAMRLAPRGVFACISPWNFPLAIFMGQVSAALATGNCVIAKPAEQTPLMAAFAVSVLHDAGVPRDALHLLPGDGAAVGAALTHDERIDGVVFTGSMETARLINRSIAARKGAIVPLIAETGGQNCMIVDSSALLEQVSDDVVLSAFGSAGQRCSALRVLYVQEEIADPLIALITGAMQELKIGDPSDPATDIGPVIDGEAQNMLRLHIDGLKNSARLLGATPITPQVQESGTFIAPHAFEIASITELKREVFGPVLHVIRYKAKDLEAVCAEINSSGYGLTFGMQSRIEDNVDVVRQRIRAGNLYVNRSMIGATVGVQPFGGEGLSGTGPKAGGPHYLLRFVTERVVTVNTAAIGGNLDLLSRAGSLRQLPAYR